MDLTTGAALAFAFLVLLALNDVRRQLAAIHAALLNIQEGKRLRDDDRFR